ncbi:hypothetical protein [Antrihabitans cavernicola]|uniref:hypothetical protein n=1 Tax=Antrihabitans cavernicola TaxID=2495913 RepID=UPI00165956D0|nr:hypothetical protein [Spelaeibacter cavernicola]
MTDLRSIATRLAVASFVLTLACGSGIASAAPGSDTTVREVPKVIFDGDVGPDPCDFSALAMAHNLHQAGEIDLLGFMSTMPEPSNVEVMDIFDRWYGHRIPIGTFEDPSDLGYDRFVRPSSELANGLFPASRTIAAHYAGWHPQTIDSVPDSVSLYRKLLAGEQDHSVTILTTGQLYNIKALLNSGPDAYSPASGMDLVRAKVSRFVMMIGAFGKPVTADDLVYYNAEYNNDPPNAFFPLTVSQHASTGAGTGAEYNALAWYPGLTQDVFAKLDRLDTPKIIIGNEEGWRVPAGDAYNKLAADHPVRMGFSDNNVGLPGVAKNDPAYDEVALVYAARGLDGYFDQTPGHAQFQNLGTSTWTDDPASRNLRLTLEAGVNDHHALSDLIESLVMGRASTWQSPAE